MPLPHNFFLARPKCNKMDGRPFLTMPANHTDLERWLWIVADELCANLNLTASEYSVPVLGLIFSRWADHKLTHAKAKPTNHGSGHRTARACMR
jgi:hypothetical protein